MRKLLVVDKAFWVEGRGVVLWPGLPLPQIWQGPAQDPHAEVRRADGSCSTCVLSVCFEHINRSLEDIRRGRPNACLTCLLNGVPDEDVVAGSEVWADDELVKRALDGLHAG